MESSVLCSSRIFASTSRYLTIDKRPGGREREDTIMSDTTTASGESAVRPFRIEVPQGEIDELRRRINAARWPTRELVTDRSQGVQLAAIQNLARYWATEYDWRRCEARLNALPQFKTEIDGLDIHFIHVGSAHENALPL
ncbi:MAG TPA: epoxide hydrolase N-terminal domain-containing protein, partial [Burkholderiaceae bacterium]|nr:epoxide hydrolase N-terminal domain-containing protein [Burkholderiaceae bacterium]